MTLYQYQQAQLTCRVVHAYAQYSPGLQGEWYLRSDGTAKHIVTGKVMSYKSITLVHGVL